MQLPSEDHCMSLVQEANLTCAACMARLRRETRELTRAGRVEMLADKRILERNQAFMKKVYNSAMEVLGNCGRCSAQVYDVQNHIWCMGSTLRVSGPYLHCGGLSVCREVFHHGCVSLHGGLGAERFTQVGR